MTERKQRQFPTDDAEVRLAIGPISIIAILQDKYAKFSLAILSSVYREIVSFAQAGGLDKIWTAAFRGRIEAIRSGARIVL
ncbi:MAG: hypothetical protein ABI147_09610, partial [Acidobacteriaceae bacterium]